MSRKFLNIYDSYFDDVYRYVYFKVGNKWDADDVVSDIFRKAYEKFGTANGDLKCWLFSISRNTVTDFYRKKKHAAVLYADITDADMEADTYPSLSSSSPEEILELFDLEQALNSLSKEELEIINLRCFADMTYSNIAKCLSKSEASIKVKFSRIIKKLKDVLEQYAEG